MELPERGFYRHYKHQADGAPFNYMYEVTGIGRNTEDKSLTVLYRPLYDSTFMPPADLQSRPIEMFFEEVEVNGSTLPRFARITDPELLTRLNAKREELYG